MDERIDELETLTGGEEQNVGISADLIRGHINTIILRSLYDGDKYGYEIIDEIEKKSGGLYTIKQPTLYSALKRLESLEYVTSYYGDYSNGGRRKYFSLSESGKKITERNLSEWEYSRTIIDSLISDGNAHYDFSFITDKQQELVELKRALAAREQALEDEKKALASLKNELQRERALLSTQSSSLSVQKDDFKELKEKVDAQTRELEEKENALLEKENEITAKEVALAQKEREIGDAKAELERQNEEIRDLKTRLETQQALFESKALEITQLREENARLEQLSLSSVRQEELETLKSELSATQADLEDKKSVIVALNSAVATQENTISILKSEYETKTTEFYNRSLELRAQQAQLEAQKGKLEEERKALEEKENALLARETTLKENAEQATTATLASLEQEREELRNQLQILEVERSTLRSENEALEESKRQLQRERDELNGMREALQAERTEIDRITYDVTQREYALQEERRNVDDTKSQTSASTEEIERLREDLQLRETELARATHKLQDDLTILQQQQKEFSARQSVYNQQQLDFIARKNALSAQQFDFADKLSSYNTQVKLFNENLEKLETERAALRAEEQRHEERVRVFELEKSEFQEKNVKFEQDKENAAKAQKELQERTAEETENLQRQFNELRERELELSRRENDLNSAAREFRSQQYAAYTAKNDYPYGYPPQYNRYENNAQYAQPQQPQTNFNWNDLRERAQSEGIKLNTAGNLGERKTEYSTPSPRATTNTVGCYNVGATLFKSAFIIFCIIAFESLLTFFVKEYLGVNAAYPAIGFAGGFITFIACAILYACGYKPRARRRKHASYILTSAIVFVICVIVATMIAVYCKAQMSNPAQLLSFVVIPVVYLLNIPFFAVFYYLFSVRASRN